MTMTINKKVQKIVRACVGAMIETKIEKLSYSKNHAKVAQLRKIERAARKYCRVNTTVYYVDAEHKSKFSDKPGTRGFYESNGDYAVIFIHDDFDYVRHVTTLCHELTHAYQKYYMTKQFNASRKDLHSGKVSYKQAWHERHAREQADIMCDIFLGYDMAM